MNAQDAHIEEAMMHETYAQACAANWPRPTEKVVVITSHERTTYYIRASKAIMLATAMLCRLPRTHRL